MRTKERAPARVVHELTVPDDLIAWGKQPEVARSWVRPWAHEVERFLRRGESTPLSGSDTDALLSRLEALCFEAIRADQGALLLGLDVFTAGWLGLRFRFETESGPVVFGESLRYGELHELADASPGAADFVLQCKQLVNSVFPQAQIDAMLDADEMAEPACSGCGTTAQAVMLSLNTGSEYCSKCWIELTARWPSLEQLGLAKGAKGAKKRA